MHDFDFHFVAKKSIQGIFALISRTFLLQLLSIVSFFVLSGYLPADVFGIYVVAQSIIVFFNYFQDIGLAASLIQKKEEPSIQEYRSVFTLQQVIVLVLVIPSLVFVSAISSFYNLNTAGMWLLVALIVSFFLTSLRTIPTVMIERKLDFGKLVLPQITENLAYYSVLIILVIAGYEINAFTIAVVTRGVVGLVTTYVIQPWSIGISFDTKSLKNLLSFGLPFQANNILALLKDDLLMVYIGKILPFAAVGYVGFAQKLAFYPLRLIMDNVIRITFPSYSRLQHDKEAMKVAIEKSLFLISFIIFPTAVGIITLAPFLFELIPKYAKWQPAGIALSFFALNTIFSSIVTPLTNLLNAIGRIKITFYFMIFWTVATWVLTPLFISLYGYNGVALASFLVSVSSVLVILYTKKHISFSLSKSIVRQLFASVGMYIFIFVTKQYVTSIDLLVLEVVAAGMVYMGLMYLLAKDEILKTIRFILKSIRKQS